MLTGPDMATGRGDDSETHPYPEAQHPSPTNKALLGLAVAILGLAGIVAYGYVRYVSVVRYTAQDGRVTVSTGTVTGLRTVLVTNKGVRAVRVSARPGQGPMTVTEMVGFYQLPTRSRQARPWPAQAGLGAPTATGSSEGASGGSTWRRGNQSSQRGRYQLR